MPVSRDDMPHHSIAASRERPDRTDHGVDIVRIAGHVQTIDVTIVRDEIDVRQRRLDLLTELQSHAQRSRRDDALGSRLRADEHRVGVEHTARGVNESRDENGNPQRAVRSAPQNPSLALATSVRCGKGWKRKYLRLSRLSTPAASDQRSFTR